MMAERPSWRDYASLRRRVVRLEREHELGDTSWHLGVCMALAAGAGGDGRAVGGAPTETAARSRRVLPPTITVPSSALEALLDLVDRARLRLREETTGRSAVAVELLLPVEGALDEATDQLIVWLDAAMVPVEVGVDPGRDEGTCYTEITATDDRSHPAPVTAPDPVVDRAPEPGFVVTGAGSSHGLKPVSPPSKARGGLVGALVALAVALVAVGLVVLEVVG